MWLVIEGSNIWQFMRNKKNAKQVVINNWKYSDHNVLLSHTIIVVTQSYFIFVIFNWVQPVLVQGIKNGDNEKGPAAYLLDICYFCREHWSAAAWDSGWIPRKYEMFIVSSFLVNSAPLYFLKFTLHFSPEINMYWPRTLHQVSLPPELRLCELRALIRFK